MFKKTGFTLSEVLITLVIIGVIASITIPALNNNINNQQYISAYKKMYSTIYQAYNRIKFDNGNSIIGVFTSADDYLDVFSNYMIKAKVCKSGNTTGNCWHAQGEWYTLNGNSISSAENSFNSLILADGSIILFMHISSDCTGNTELKTNTGCARLRTDINGFKGPNRVGKDIYDFYLLEDRVIARGDPLSTADINNESGWGKGFKILSEGSL